MPAQSLLPKSADAPSDENVKLDAYVVSSAPIFQSQTASIEAQRAAANVVSVIASDSVGRFPDQNAAAALGRLPAIAIQRDQGQERFVQVRGAPSRWTTVAFDGVNVIGAQERVFRFDSVPAVILESLEVNKTLLSQMPAESIAGRVNLRTFSPFTKPGWSGLIDGGYGQMMLGDGGQQQFAGRLSWSGDSFGVVLGASHYLREQITDNREMVYDAQGRPEDFDFRSYRLERRNNAFTGGLEWRPQDGHRVFFRSVYTEFVDDEERNQFIFDLASAFYGRRDAESGELVGVRVNEMLQYGRYDNSTFTHTLGGDHFLSDWQINWRVNLTDTEFSTDLPIIRRLQTAPTQFVSVTYDHTNRHFPELNLFKTVFDPGAGAFVRGPAMPAVDQTAYGLDLLIPYVFGNESNALVYKVDASRDLSFPNRTWTVSTGFQVDLREAAGSTVSSPKLIYLNPTAAALGLSWNANPFVTDKSWDSDFPRAFDAKLVDNIGLRGALTDLLAQFPTAIYDPNNLVGAADRYSIDEDIVAFFASAATTFGRGHQVTFGARVEQVDLTSKGSFIAGTTVSPLTVNQDYTDVFPNVNVKFELAPDLLLRAGLTSGIGRPDFTQLRVGATVSDTDRFVSGGNPTLEPERAWGGDVSLEWYFAEGALASVSVFVREVDDVLFDATSTVTDDRYDSNGIDRTGYTYNTSLNGESGQLRGLEFAYSQQWRTLPAPFDGLGFQANLAFLDGEFTALGREVGFPGTSKTITNASLYYEKHGASVRLSYQWRDAWLDDVDIFGTNDAFWASAKRLDLSVRYQFNRNVTFYADINNFTDELGVRYEREAYYPIEVEGFGRRFLAGVKVNF